MQKVEKPAHIFNLPSFEDKDDPRVVLSNKGASLLDIGNGVALLNFHTKMNALDLDIVEMIQKSVAYVDQNFEALVIGNQGQAFSAGANIALMLELINKGDFDSIDKVLQ